MITTISTVKDEIPSIETWINANIKAGADRMIVFLDQSTTPGDHERLAAHPRVIAIGPDEWWQGARPGKLNERQHINSNAALALLRKIDPRGWAFHIDGDEVLNVDKSRLNALPPEVEAVQLSPLEAVAQWSWPENDAVAFKRLLAQNELDLLYLLGAISRPSNGSYFRGHVRGKAGVRVSSAWWLGTHRAIDRDRSPAPSFSRKWLQVLHYESYTFAEFVRKWTNLATSGPPVLTRHERGRLGSAIRAASWSQLDEEQASALWKELFATTTLDDLEMLGQLGLLVHPPSRTIPSPVGTEKLRADDLRVSLIDLAPPDQNAFRFARRSWSARMRRSLDPR